MSMKFIPQSREDQDQLLKTIGVSSPEELFAYIPQKFRLKSALDFPKAQSESEIRKTFAQIAELSKAPSRSFAGCGIYQHEIPSIVPFIQGRSEFSTAYTPYQPEISQGLLQTIFEFQSLVCMLTECQLSNASLYDGATSLAEAALMALRIKKKSSGKILISSSIHPFYIEVLNTYLTEFQDRIEMLPISGDQVDYSAVAAGLKKGADVLVTQSPNVFGVVENLEQVGESVRASEGIWVTSTMEPFSWGVLRGPGAFGAHIVTAEGQSFGNAPYLGGSSFGIFATRDEYIRNLPGRLVGETVDQKGRRSYTLTFATREQFIRRDKATSNICTNQNLNMLAGLIHMVTLGKEGMREVAVQNLSLTEFVKERIRKETKVKISASPTFNEFVADLSIPAAQAVQAAVNEGWVAGVDLGRFKDSWKHKLLIHVSETHNLQDFDHLIRLLQKVS